MTPAKPTYSTASLGRGNGEKPIPTNIGHGRGRGRGLPNNPKSYEPPGKSQTDEEYASILQADEMNQFEDSSFKGTIQEDASTNWTLVAKSNKKKSTSPTSSSRPTQIDLTTQLQEETTKKVTFSPSTDRLLNNSHYSTDKASRKEKWARQRQTSYGKLDSNESFSCYMLILLPKEKNDYKPFTAQSHLNHFRSLLLLLKESDPTISLLPLDELAEDQTPLTEIPQELKSIWNKALYRYISSKHCTFGNQFTHQSLRIRLKTDKQIDPWQLGNYAHHTWGIPNGCHIMPDRIQEGVKAKIAFVSNVADTTNNRDLSLDLELALNDKLVQEKELAFTKRASKDPSLLEKGNPDFTRPIRINVLPGLLEMAHNGQVHQAQVSWIYCGRQWVRKVIQFLNQLNQDVYENDDKGAPPSQLRIADRNIMITIDRGLSVAHRLEIIKHQNSYFTSIQYKHNVNLPSPLTRFTKKDGNEVSLREYLLDLSNKDPKAGNYQLFTQVDRGNTIKSGENCWTSRGITFTYHQCVSQEAESTILSLHQIFKEDIKPEFLAELLPDYFSIPEEEKQLYKNRNSTKMFQQMERLCASSHSSVLTTPTRPTIVPPAPLSITQIRNKARGITTSRTKTSISTTTAPTYSSVTASLSPTTITFPNVITPQLPTSPTTISTVTNQSRTPYPMSTQIVPHPTQQLLPLNSFQSKLDDLSKKNQETSNALDQFNDALKTSMDNINKLQSTFITATTHLLQGQEKTSTRLNNIEEGISKLLQLQSNAKSFDSQENGGSKN